MTRLFISTLFAALLLLLCGGGCSDQAKMQKHLARAESYFKSGELEKAKIEFLGALRYERTNALAISRLGVIYFDQGAAQQATPFLLGARKLVPEDMACRRRLGQLLLLGKEYSKAREEAVAVLAKLPGDDEAVQLLAHASQTPADVSDAQQRLTQLRQQLGDRSVFHLASAELLFRNGNAAAGEAELRQAVSMDPKAYAARMALGNLYLSRTNLALAEAEYRQAAESAPPRSGAPLRFAEFEFQTGKREEAKKILGALLAQVPDSLPGKRLLGQIALAEKNYDEAQRAVDSALQIDPSSLDVRLLQAEIQMARGQPAKAAETLEKIEQAYPEMPEIKYQLARACLASNKSTRAAGLLEQATALKPDYVDAVLLSSTLQMQNGEAARAVATLQNLLKLRPELVNVQLQLAQAYVALGRPDDATAIQRKLTQTQPKDGQGWYALGSTLRQQGQRAEARRALETAATLAADSVAPVAQLIEMDLEEKEYARALARLKPEGRAPRQGPLALQLEARIYAAQKDWGKSEAVLQKAIEADTNSTVARYLLASVYSESKQPDRAITQLESLLAKNPREQQALMTLAVLVNEKQDWPKARDTYEKLLAINTNSVAAMNNLAYLYAEKLNQTDKALELAQKARSLVPNDPAIADTLGWVLYQQKKFSEALPLVQESSAKLRDNAEVWFHLGMTSAMLGQEQAARTALQQALTLAGTGTFAGKEEAQRRFAQLQPGGSPGAAGTGSLAELEQHVKTHPEDVTSTFRLAERYRQEGSADKAAPLLHSVVAANPRSQPALTQLAQLYAGPLASKAKAVEYAKKAWEYAPGNPEIAFILGRAAYESREFPYAFNFLRDSVRSLESRAEVQYDFAWSAYTQGRESEAIAAMQRALALNTNLPTANAGRWFLLLTAASQNLSSLPNAEQQAAQVLKSEPSNVPALMVLGLVQSNRGEIAPAIVSYEKALATYPEFAPARKHLALLYARQPGQESKASDMALKARESLPQDADLAALLGKINYLNKNYPTALSYLLESTSRKTNDAEAFYYLGMTHLQSKDKAKSKQALDRAVASGLQAPLLQEARRILTETP